MNTTKKIEAIGGTVTHDGQKRKHVLYRGLPFILSINRGRSPSVLMTPSGRKSGNLAHLIGELAKSGQLETVSEESETWNLSEMKEQGRTGEQSRARKMKARLNMIRQERNQ